MNYTEVISNLISLVNLVFIIWVFKKQHDQSEVNRTVAINSSLLTVRISEFKKFQEDWSKIIDDYVDAKSDFKDRRARLLKLKLSSFIMNLDDVMPGCMKWDTYLHLESLVAELTNEQSVEDEQNLMFEIARAYTKFRAQFNFRIFQLEIDVRKYT